ncbi:tetratricopeptide repeat protein [Neisseria montereyensis]|uniref:Tetratricopeptide repeat protein n=1 Tax=Neisseria montereyensis TaxID=2973938 RepID=A0ABT2FBC5_9NEIS|nr:tetratricopeptide repeat protein [Neisseria montereyensis]MCS4532860.1 tetratricopeptide repeat protein [Neisseria montereyensis]
MFFGNVRIRSSVAAVLLLFAAQANALGEATKQPQEYVRSVNPVTTGSNSDRSNERLSEYERRVGIVDRANKLFTLLGGEMSLQKGQTGTALATYIVMLDRTKDAAVAERAMEMAISLHAYRQAEQIFQKWREIEPEPGEAQRRMAWMRNLVIGQNDSTGRELKDILDHAGEERVRRIFLMLAQLSLQQSDLAQKAGKDIHKAAREYKSMPEAAIADVIFSAQRGRERDAVAALQRLAELDTQILPPTEVTLRLVARHSPKILSRFFDETNSSKLSPVWQELEISSLLAQGQPDRAYRRLQTLLNENPNADLYIQAAILSVTRQEDVSVVGNYLDKAYRIGTGEQKSRAAVIGAMRYAEAKKFKEAKAWADKITSPEYAFDKIVLSASIEAEQGNGANALAEVRRARQLPDQEGRFFNMGDIQRVYLFALSKNNNPQEVLKELNALATSVEQQPNSREYLPDILYQRAMLYADQLNSPEKAIVDLRRYLALSPNSAAGLNALGYTMLSLPDYNIEEAFRLIQAAYQQEPESAAINDSLGWVYYLKGDAQTALPYLEYAFKEYPDAEVSAHLGEVLWKLGQQDKARQVWQEGLTKEGDTALLKKTLQRFGVTLPKTTVKKK